MTPSHQPSRIQRILSAFARALGNSVLYGVLFTLTVWALSYAASSVETKLINNFGQSGIDFISFLTSGDKDGSAGVDAKSLYARVNGSWLGYPKDGGNYLRNKTFLSGTLYDENNTRYYVNPDGTTNLNQLCLNGDCKTGWNTTSNIGTVWLKWSNIYGASGTGTTYNTAANGCASLSPAGTWRLPTSEELEVARRADSNLFTGTYSFWTGTPGIYGSDSYYDFFTWSPERSGWFNCSANAKHCSNGGSYVYDDVLPVAYRCVTVGQTSSPITSWDTITTTSTDVPSGTMCGSSQKTTLRFTCDGHDPRISCPAWYSSTIAYHLDYNSFYTCVKD